MHLEINYNIALYARCGSRSQCHHRNSWERVSQRAESAIIWSEVVTPLRHAVSFIDGEQTNTNFGVQFTKRVDKPSCIDLKKKNMT